MEQISPQRKTASPSMDSYKGNPTGFYVREVRLYSKMRLLFSAYQVHVKLQSIRGIIEVAWILCLIRNLKSLREKNKIKIKNKIMINNNLQWKRWGTRMNKQGKSADIEAVRKSQVEIVE